jgi:hypothetical protein
MICKFARKLGIATLALGLAATAALAQPTRVRGTLERIDGNTLSIKARDGGTLTVVLADNALVIAIEKRTLADIKPGVFLGTAAEPGPDGTLRALEIHIFPEAMRGTGEGHRPWERAGTSMTNATVEESVSAVSGNTFTLRYRGGEQKVTVTSETPIVGYVTGTRGDLAPGKAISITAATRAEDGTLRAARINVERTAPPPL